MRKLIRFLIYEIFLKRITIFKWQLNLCAAICVGLGIVLGIYAGVDKLSKLYALNDTYTTWNYNQANIADFTYDSSLINVNAGSVSPGVNLLANTGFESDLASWGVVQPYIVNDQFITDGPVTLVSGTAGLSNGGVITPTGIEKFVDGGLEANYTAGKCDSLGVQVAPPLAQSADVHGGSKAQQVTTTVNNQAVSQTIVMPNYRWVLVSGWGKKTAGVGADSLGVAVNGVLNYAPSFTDAAYTQKFKAIRSYGAFVVYPIFHVSSATTIVDDISALLLDTPSLFSTASVPGSQLVFSAGVTLTSGTTAGFVINLDSAETPANYILAYHDGSVVRLDKVVGGIYTPLIASTTPYVAGAQLKVAKNGNIYKLIYNNTQIGADQTISEASIVNNTLHGLFSTYSTNSFSNFLITTNLDGTQAEPTGGTRIINDSMNKLSISGGSMSLPNSTAAGNPRLMYSSVGRQAGRILGISLIPNSGDWGFGFNATATPTATPESGYYGTGATLYNNAGANLLTYVYGQNYLLYTVIRASGSYSFVKGGSYADWTLVGISSTGSSATLYPGINARSNVFYGSFDDIKIPTTTWLPTPIAYDSFSDGDGVIGNTEVVGPDGVAGPTVQSLAWTGSTWSILGGKIMNTPSTGVEKILNGSFENGNPPTSWSPSGTPATFEQSSLQVQDGSYSLRMITDAVNEGVSQATGLTTNTWYQSTGYIYPIGNGDYINFGQSYNNQYLYMPLNQWTKMTTIGPATSANSGLSKTYASEFYIDNVSVKPMVLQELFATVQSGRSDVFAEVAITLESNVRNRVPTGLVLRMDNAENPQNFIVVTIEGGGANNAGRLIIRKFTGGVYSTVTANDLSASGTSYTAGAKLQVTVSGSSVRAFYNNRTITITTVADLGIINNTIHGVFSPYSGNTLDDFALFSPTGYTDAPFEDLIATRDTGIKYSGNASVQLQAQGTDANFLQTKNVGEVATYTLSAYVYKGVGQAVTTSDVNLFYDTGVITTTFTPVGNDWYHLSGTVTGENLSKSFGVRVKAGKTLYVDDMNLYKNGEYIIYSTDSFYSINLSRIDSFQSVQTTPGSSTIKYQFCAGDSATCESGSTWQYWDGAGWVAATNNTTDSNIAGELSQAVLQELGVAGSHKVAVKAIMAIGTGGNFPTLSSVTIGMTLDTVRPTNATNPLFIKSNDDRCDNIDNCWSNRAEPAYEWTAGSDSSGIMGYCLYLGTDANGDPINSKGKLGDSPLPTANTACHFISGPAPSVDMSANGYIASPLSNLDTFISEPNTYFLNIKAIDNAGNESADFVSIKFQFDGTGPTNVGYITTPSGNFSNIIDMNFAWPVIGNGISEDNESGMLGWQYQINSSTGAWKGTAHNDEFNIDYIPLGTSSYQLTEAQDGLSIVSGNNIIYFRSIDLTGNPSSNGTVRTGNISFGGQAPTFGGTDVVTILPETNTTNYYELSWPEATPAAGKTVTHYYYSVGVPPAATLETVQNNVGTYFDNGTNLSVPADSLPNVNKGANTIYVVAIDDNTPPNYSPSTYITGTFILNSTNPDNVGNLVASDSSIKSQSMWNVTLTWTIPSYQGAGNLTYLIYRSTDGVSFTQVGSSNGLSYVDSAPASALYYYKVVTRDGANSLSSGSNTVTITPTGKWTVPADLDSGPFVSNISTKKATITWTTSRASDSKIAYGTLSGVYGIVEPSNPSQVTGHTIELTGLNPSTTYYFKAKWTDEDGNTAESEEKMFQTAAPPSVKNVVETNIGLDYAVIRFTTVGANSVKIYYGRTSGFGGLQQISTSLLETTYTAQLTGLDDGVQYYYKINTLDSDGNEYDGTILDFNTLPRPYISNVNIYEVTGTAQTTMNLSWESNTEISSIVTYYPDGAPGDAKDEVNVTLIKGKHKMLIRGLLPHTKYVFIIKGVDRVGNEAVSDPYMLTSSTDSRPPVIYNIETQGEARDQSAQLVVSWDTDEPSTSQVEYGEGSGTTYSQKTLEDANLTYNHVIVITNLTPSKVYHIRVISKDAATNEGKSIDTVTITPKSNDNAFDLVISNLLKAFGFE